MTQTKQFLPFFRAIYHKPHKFLQLVRITQAKQRHGYIAMKYVVTPGVINVSSFFYESRLSGGDTQSCWEPSNSTYCNQICGMGVRVRGGADIKTSSL